MAFYIHLFLGSVRPVMTLRRHHRVRDYGASVCIAFLNLSLAIKSITAVALIPSAFHSRLPHSKFSDIDHALYRYGGVSDLREYVEQA
jgi:hypothetical protein